MRRFVVAFVALVLVGGLGLAQPNHIPNVRDDAPVFTDPETGQTNVVIVSDWKELYPFSERFGAEAMAAQSAGVSHIIDLATVRFATDNLVSQAASGARTFAAPDLRSFPADLVRDAFGTGTLDYFIVQAESPELLANLRKWLEGNRIKILGYIPNNAYLVRVDRNGLAALEQRKEAFWAGYYQPAFRVDPKLDYVIEANPTSHMRLRTLLDLTSYSSIQAVRDMLAYLKVEVLDITRSDDAWIVRIEADVLVAREVAMLPGCIWVERFLDFELHNNIARTSTNVTTGRGASAGPIMDVEDVWARGIRGEGQIASAADTGLSTGTLTTLHQDFGVSGSTTNPLRVIKGYALGRSSTWDDNQTTGGGHGTHTSGSIVGNGFRSGSDPSTNSFPTTSFAGNAPKAQFVFQSVMDSSGGLGGLPSDLTTLFQSPYNDGARVHSNSWGSAAAGAYDANAQQVDKFVWNNKDMVITFSAGNSGVDGKVYGTSCATNGKPIDGVIDTDSIGSPGTAKNCITVGASENYRPDFVYEYPENDCTSSDGVEQKTWGWFNSCSYSVAPVLGDVMADNANGMGAFSSRGPCDDNRIKPDVVAPGIAIISTRTDKNQAYEQWGTCQIPTAQKTYYMSMGGTSMANPLTAGAAVLVRQYYADGWHANNSAVTNSAKNTSHAFNPTAALVKATMVNGAWDMTPGQFGTGTTKEIAPGWDTGHDLPNNAEGYGRVDLEHALFPGSGWGDVADRKLAVYDVTTGLATNGYNDYTFTVSGSSNPLIVTVVWSDPYAATGSGTKLVNDLDLTVTAPGGTIYYPNGLNKTSGADHVNNVEQVKVTSPASGTWSIRVKGYNVPGNGVSGTTSQPYALVISGISGGTCNLPTVSVSAPTAGATLTGTVTLSANVTADPAATQVDFLVDGSVVGSDTTSPWSISWNSASVSDGSHTITARATNSCGSATSAGVAVTTSNTVPTYSITGTITYNSAGLSGVVVSTGSASATTNSSGVYTIAGLANGTYTVTPTLAGYTFTPTSLSATISSANVTGKDFTATSTGGPVTLFTDGFEAAGWSTAQVSGTAGSWTLAASGTHPTAAAHGGTKLAVFNSYTSASGNQTRLYKAAGFAIASSYSSATLTFWMYHDTGYSTYADKVQPQVSTNGTTWTNVGSAINRYAATAGWTQHTVDLTSYKGQASVQLGFLGISAYGNDCYIDDVLVVASGTAPVTYSISGTITYNSAGLSGVNVSTGGASATTNSSGVYTITGLANGTYAVTPSLAGYTFTPTSQSVTISGANVTGKNFTAATTGIVTLFTDGFESTGWSVVDTSGTAGNWTFPSSGTHPAVSVHGGTKLALFNSYTAASGNQTRVYRASGFAIASTYTTVTLKFWMYHDTGYTSAADKVQAQVSTNGTTWTNVGTAVNRYDGSTGWKQHSVDISTYKGQSALRLAFVGISAYGNDEHIDDVTVTAQ
ncbi:MAG TPA: S8 family serine peptidase [Thermoanaerobaculaceae bacterium]|nr:S8 family serine peptidase [Thermoanaerobaculaceae bacterium]